MKRVVVVLVCWLFACASFAQTIFKERKNEQVLISKDGHSGVFAWKMKKAGDIVGKTEDVSTIKVSTDDWMPAIVPGTILNSLVYNKVYPEPYFGLNNKLESNLIPDL